LTCFAAVVDLEKAGVLHRDISMGNILLKREIRNEQFFDVVSQDLTKQLHHLGHLNALSALFFQRPFDPEETGGLLHDFDMAGSVTFSNAHQAPPKDDQTHLSTKFKELMDPPRSVNYLKARRTVCSIFLQMQEWIQLILCYRVLLLTWPQTY
jgi:hypothetical protein